MKNMSCRGGYDCGKLRTPGLDKPNRRGDIPNAVLMKGMVSCQPNFFNCKRQTQGYMAFVNNFAREI